MVVVAVQKLHAFTCARIYGLACIRTYHIGGLACGGQFGDGWMHWHGEGQAPLPSTHISHAGWACDQTNARQVIKTKRVANPCVQKKKGPGLVWMLLPMLRSTVALLVAAAAATHPQLPTAPKTYTTVVRNMLANGQVRIHPRIRCCIRDVDVDFRN